MTGHAETLATRRQEALRRDILLRTVIDRNGIHKDEWQGLTSYLVEADWLPDPYFECFDTEAEARAWLASPWPTRH